MTAAPSLTTVKRVSRGRFANDRTFVTIRMSCHD